LVEKRYHSARNKDFKSGGGWWWNRSSICLELYACLQTNNNQPTNAEEEGRMSLHRKQRNPKDDVKEMVMVMRAKKNCSKELKRN